MHFYKDLHLLVACSLLADHPAEKREMLVQLSKPVLQWQGEKQQQDRQKIITVSGRPPEAQFSADVLFVNQTAEEKGGQAKLNDRVERLNDFPKVDRLRIRKRLSRR